CYTLFSELQLNSLPTRRSSDLKIMRINDKNGEIILHCGTMFGGKSSALLSDVRKCRIANLNVLLLKPIIDKRYSVDKVVNHDGVDRKSTRLNSSHVSISYAVFC